MLSQQILAGIVFVGKLGSPWTQRGARVSTLSSASHPFAKARPPTPRKKLTRTGGLRRRRRALGIGFWGSGGFLRAPASRAWWVVFGKGGSIRLTFGQLEPKISARKGGWARGRPHWLSVGQAVVRACGRRRREATATAAATAIATATDNNNNQD